MERSHVQNRLFSWKLLIATIFSYIFLFALDVVLFRVSGTTPLPVFYGYFLFPIFAIIHGVVSYKTTKRLFLPNIVYFLYCFLFIIIFTVIGMLFENNHHLLRSFPALERALEVMPLIGFVTTISVAFSGVISIAASLIAKLSVKLICFLRMTVEKHGDAKFRKVIIILNVLLLCAMVIHVGVKMFLHGQHPEYSAPAYIQLIYAVYYLIPLAAIDVIGFLVKNK